MGVQQDLLIKISPVRRRIIAEVGNVRLRETIYTIEKASVEDANLLRITRQFLLPSRTRSEYITIREAYEETGISMSKLRRLARERRIEAMKIKRRWLILRDSLHQYIEENAAQN